MTLRFPSSRYFQAAITLATLVAGAPARAEFPQFGGTQPGEITPNGAFQNADTCTACHGGGFMNDKTFLPFDTWGGTMMANSARDPVFFAALAVANQSSPPEDVEHCVRCHSPVGYVRGHTLPSDGSALDAVDQHGVSCEVCHRAVQTPSAEDYYLHGDTQLVFSPDEQSKHGKYPDAQSPAHSVIVDDGLTKYDFCAQCHIVTNPGKNLIDKGGADLGIPFPVETTFFEWKQSKFPDKGEAFTCQGCHMPKKVGMFPVSKLFGEPTHIDPRQHQFAGGNHWGIRAVMEANPDRAAKYPDAFQNALNNTEAMLKTAAAVSLVEAPPATLAAGQAFDIKVRVENKTGHKFPTGYVDGRRAWVAVEIIDKNGASHPLAGAYDTATGTIAADPPTHIYHAVHGRWDGAQGVPEHNLMQQDMLLSDSRIPPEGFIADQKTVVTDEVDFKDGMGGYNHFDEIAFSLTAPAGVSGVASLSARVYFQSISREYVDFLKAANTPAGDALSTIYQATDQGPPMLVASAEAAVDFGGEISTGGSAGAGGTAGTGGSSGSSGSSGTGGSAGSSGSAGNAGSGPAGSGGAGGDGGGGGCGCGTAPGDTGALGSIAALLALGAVLRRRRFSRS